MKDYDQFVEVVAPFIDAETLQGARDVSFGQWELPFEAILIALTKCKRDEVNLDFSCAEALAKEAAITNGGGVLDPSSWADFVNWERGH